ncbi:unnamed protein product [Zymoseptoria tritici ST99CH_3D1]|nr:unnamed protein product [Zymoseptoria tritici ST99CH_3D1]
MRDPELLISFPVPDNSIRSSLSFYSAPSTAHLTRITSTVGIWLAVAILLVTIPGVILALLVRRASKTPRNKALAAIDSGSRDHYGYITRGVPLPRGIRLLRTVNAPILDGAPEVVGRRVRWNNERDIPLESPGWIQMAETFKAFGMTFETGDNLIFGDDKSFGMGQSIGHNYPRLPISPSWISALGLAGRFGVRPDDGKWPKRLLTDHHTTVGSNDTVSGRLPSYQWDDFEEPLPDWARDDATKPPAMHDFDMMARTRLAGLVGVIRFGYWPDSHISFTGHEPDEIGGNLNDTLDVASLFWLAVGCLPLEDGRISGFDNVVQEITTEPTNLPGDLGFMPGPPIVSSKGRSKKKSGKRHRNGKVNIKASYLGELVTFAKAQAEVPRLYRLSATNKRVDALSNLAALVGAETAATHALSLEELQISPEEMLELIADSRETYVPCHRIWIRLTRKMERHEILGGSWFLLRGDAQLLALALIELPICPHGVLMYKQQMSLLRELLEGTQELLPRLLTQIGRHLALFRLEPAETSSLEAAMLELLACLTSFKYTRAFGAALSSLDDLIGSVRNMPSRSIQVVVQAVVLTSREFRDLVVQSLRSIEDCMSTSLFVDMTNSTLDMEVILGTMKKFPVDLGVLLPELTPEEKLVRWQIPYTYMLLLTLRAALKSAYLRTSLDSQPLFDLVLGMDDLGYVQ